MGHPNPSLSFAVGATPSGDSKFRTAYPHGNWPGIGGSASGAGTTIGASAPASSSTGAAAASAAGKTDGTIAPDGSASGGGGGDGPGSADLFTADYSTELGNWTAYVGDEFEPEFFDRSLIVGGGPKGLNAIQFVGQPASGISDRVIGGHRLVLANQAAGVWRYFRFYHLPNASNNYRAADGGRIIHKMLMLGDPGDDPRFILDVQGLRDGGPQIFAIFDGGPEVGTSEESSPYSNGQWMSIQAGVRWGSGTSDFKVWINNDTFASPTFQSLGSSFTNGNNGEMYMGGYCNDELAASGVWTFRHAAYRAATTFDSNFHTWRVT